MYVNSCYNFWGYKCDQERRQKNLKYSYKDLKTEIQYMRNVTTKVIPVITGASRTISESFRKYRSNIQGKHDKTSRN